MLFNYFKSTLRFLSRTTIYSTLNVVGLVLGITASAFLFIYVWDELRHDQFHAKKDLIYRIITEQQNGTRGVTTPGPLADQLLEKYPEVEAVARVGKWSGAFKVKDQVYEESEVYFVDNSFFKIFDFKILKGNKNTVLTNKNEIVLTKKIAVKFFGSDWRKRSDVIGHGITMNGDTQFTIVGVAENPPSFSSIQFDYLISFEFMKADRWNYQWGSHNFHTYVQVKENADVKGFESQIRDAIKSTEFNEGFNLKLQRLTDMYLESFAAYDWGRHGDRQYIIAFAIIAVLILMVACFNYINLATSQAVRRAKEIGIRKVNGAGRLNIFFQFMGESTLIVVFATLVARAIVDLGLPYFNELSGRHFAIGSFQSEIAVLFLILAAVTSLLAGIYPAIALANVRSLNMMKMSIGTFSKSKMRTVLVTTQFCVSLVLIAVTIMMFRQLRYMQGRDLGFNSHELVYIKLAGSLRNANQSFKEELQNLSYVQGATRSTTTLVNTDNGSYIEWPGKKQGGEISITQMNVDSDFMSVVDIQLVDGRAFTPTDSNAYMLNETAIRAMGLTNKDALGMKVKFWGTEGTVVGIVKDFHFRPLHYGIAPLILRHNVKENFYQLLVRVEASKIETLQQEAARLYKKYEDTFPFSYGIVDDLIEREYQGEQRVSRVVTVFSCLAIFISLLGVVGLVAHAIQERSKEFSIRKVLGLHLGHLIFLLSRRLVITYFFAALIATPIAYVLIIKWMENFSYRVSITPDVFAITFSIVLALALSIILVQAVTHIRKRTVDALRSE
jgi:putative ABC transport system permease protein